MRSWLTPLAQRRSITLFQECEDVSIKGSDTLIYRLLFNLVENGIKYNTPGGSVHITIRQKKSSAVLRVADTGCGIPEEYRTSVFQPFFRVDKSRSREMGGVGLGLALVREIALLHGGTVTAEPAGFHSHPADTSLTAVCSALFLCQFYHRLCLTGGDGRLQLVFQPGLLQHIDDMVFYG